MPKLGILGGTFDPVHTGHVTVATQCRDRLGLDEVLLVPSFLPPHRQAPAAAAADRLAMTLLATADVAGLGVDDLEVRRGGVSYAVETVRELRHRDPGGDVVLLLGEDAALEFGSWHAPEEIGRLARVAVFNRGAGEKPRLDTLAQAGLPADSIVVEVDSPPVSATEVRRRLATGDDLEGMLPSSVLDYIRERGLYGISR